MKILELFLNCNKINVICAFEKLFPYESYDWLCSRNLPNIFKWNEYLSFVLDDIKTKAHLLTGTDISPNMVYIIETQSTDIDDKTTSFYVLHIEKPSGNIKMGKVSNMSLALMEDDEKNKVIFNTPIVQSAIEKYGIDICATIILHELILFGYRREDIKKNHEHIISKLKESEEDVKNGRVISMEEMDAHLDKWREELYQGANKYERAVMEANDLKSEHLKEIAEEYRNEKMQENIKAMEDMVNDSLVEPIDEDEAKMVQLVNMLNGREYGSETTKEIETFAKENGLVICFGASDDLLELRGVIDDEFGAYEGTTIYLNPTTKEVSQRKREEFPYFVKLDWGKSKLATWTFETNIKHKTFTILEDNSVFCIGIAFYLK